MGLLPAGLLTQFQAGNRDIAVVVELGLPGGTRRFGYADVDSDSLGPCESRITSISPRTRTHSDREKQLQIPSLVINMDNQENWFNKIVDGSNGDTVVGSSVVVKLVHKTASAYTDYTGEIEGWTEPEPKHLSLSMRPPDRPLRKIVPRERITKADWPVAAAAAYGKIVPQALGVASAVGNVVTGALPTFFVDNSAFRHLVCHGRATILRAYRDGGQQTDFTVEYLTRNGKLFTVVKWNSNPGAAVVTVDVSGYETVGDGSGTLITNPLTQLKHWLDQFVWGEYLGGNWLAATTPIDATLLAETQAFFDAYGLQGSIYVGDTLTAEDLLNDWCKSHQVDAWWTNLGKLAFRIDDPRQPGTGYSGPWVRGDVSQVGRLSTSSPGRFTRDRIQATYLPSPAGGSLFGSLEVRDTSLPVESSEELALNQGAAFLE